MKHDRYAIMLGTALAILFLLVAAFPPPSAGSSLDVTTLASMGGSYGLKVNVAPPGCSPDDLVIESPPGPVLISGDFEACNTITARNVQVFAPGATFTAGDSITLENGFSVGLIAPFTARLSDVLGTQFAYVEDISPDGEEGYEARFFLDLLGLPLGATDRLELLNGYSADGQVQFKLIVKRNVSPPENRLVLAARQNDGSLVETPFGEEQLLGTIFSDIWMQWSAGDGDGYLVTSVNDAVATGLTGLTNSNSRIDSIRFGAVGGTLDPATEGFFYLDEFTSQRIFDLTEAPCVVPDDGSGTGEFPPLECAYLSPTGDYRITAGLPAGTEIVLEPIQHDFSCVVEGCGVSGGALGGEIEAFLQTLVVKAVGTGTLAGYERLLNLGGTATTYTAP
ncbi:MAG: hypothetical protein OEM62_07010, partial [Acidobacteriota bacterium]|nr:hypothetical protein [Acidobacteriota bacterium]